MLNPSPDSVQARPPVARVSARQVPGWFLAGWQMFLAQPLQWILMALTVFVLMAVISMLIVPVPLLGPMVPPVVFALLVGSLLVAAERQAAGATLHFRDLYEGALPRLGSLALVGLLFSVPLILLQLLAMVALAGGLLVGIFGYALGGALNDLLGGLESFLKMMLAGGTLLLVVWLLMVLVLIFSPALIVLRSHSTLDAMLASLRASARNPGAILVFGLSLYALFALALAPLGLGIVLFIPVAIGALRQASRDLFSAGPIALPPAATTQPVGEEA